MTNLFKSERLEFLKHGLNGYIVTLMISFLIVLMLVEVPEKNKDILMTVSPVVLTALSSILTYNKGKNDERNKYPPNS